MASTMFGSSQMYEQGLNFIMTNGNLITVNTSSPATAAAARSDALAATSSGAAAAATSDYTIGTASPDGYQIQIAQWANMQVTTAGSAKNITISACSSSEILYYTTCDTKALTTADTVTIPAWNIELRDPTSS